MTDELAKARDKISKLLNMTTANGATEDEQETALRMAANIATRHGIELNSVQAKTGDAPKRKATSKTLNQEWKIHQVLAAQAAAELYGVSVYSWNNGKGGIFFVGREENIELTEQTMFWLMRQVELLYKEYLPRGMTQKARAEYRKTFKAACAHRVYTRASQMMFEMRMNERTAQAATGQNALVVQDYFKTLRQENNDYFAPDPEQVARMKQREEDRRNALTPQQRADEDHQREIEARRAEKKASKRKGPRPRTLPTGNGTEAGNRAGDSVRLRREIS